MEPLEEEAVKKEAADLAGNVVPIDGRSLRPVLQHAAHQYLGPPHPDDRHVNLGRGHEEAEVRDDEVDNDDINVRNSSMNDSQNWRTVGRTNGWRDSFLIQSG